MGGLTLTYDSHSTNEASVNSEGKYAIESLQPQRRYTNFATMSINGSSVGFSAGQTKDFEDAGWSHGPVIATIYGGNDMSVVKREISGTTYRFERVPISKVTFINKNKIEVEVSTEKIIVEWNPPTTFGSIEFYSQTFARPVIINGLTGTIPSAVNGRVRVFDKTSKDEKHYGYSFNSAGTTIRASENGGVYMQARSRTNFTLVVDNGDGNGFSETVLVSVANHFLQFGEELPVSQPPHPTMPLQPPGIQLTVFDTDKDAVDLLPTVGHLARLGYSSTESRGFLRFSPVFAPNTFRMFEMYAITSDAANNRQRILLDYTTDGKVGNLSNDDEVHLTFTPRGELGEKGQKGEQGLQGDRDRRVSRDLRGTGTEG